MILRLLLALIFLINLPVYSACSGGLDSGSYASKSFSFSGQETSAAAVGIAIGNSDSAFYVMLDNGGILQYTLSTPGDLSTASYASKKYSSIQANDGGDIFFKSDGTKMYLQRRDGDSYQYSLSTAWDVSTASYDTKTLSVGASKRSMFIGDDGNSMFHLHRTSGDVDQYYLSTPWDISTGTADTPDDTVTAVAGRQVYLSSDGIYLFLANEGSTRIDQWSLSTPWDISTATTDSINLSVSGQVSGLEGLTFSSDYSNLYAVGSGSQTVYQYNSGISCPAGGAEANVIFFGTVF